MNIARVVVDVPSSQTDRIFDYRIPERLKDLVRKGMRVTVPFGPRKVMGFVIDLADRSELERLKDIDDVMDITPVLTSELLETGKWLSEQTLCFYISAYQAMLPQVLKAKYRKEIRRLTEEKLSAEMETVFAGRDVVPYEEFVNKAGSYARLLAAVQDGLLEVNYQVQSKGRKKQVTMIACNRSLAGLDEAMANLPGQAVKQKQLLAHFAEKPEPITLKQLLVRYEASRSSVKPLLKAGLLREYKQEVYRNPYQDENYPRTTALELTEEQEAAIRPVKKNLKEEKHEVFLLHGVTGSGKTEVYLQSIQEVIDRGKEAIVLVPEIALTPQTVQRFKGRFGSNVAVLHSALSAGEKFDEWRKIQRKEVQVAVGARSAIFAPFENIGIIIIDEEHETSYKQEDHPRYHARDVAVFRAGKHNCPVILGSATPMLETYARARKGVYQLLTLSRRMNNASMPKVKLVDMREELHAGNRSMFSVSLKQAIEDRLDRKEQIVLFLNRRGYSTFVMCRDCGHVSECPHCDIALTYHRNTERLKCHYCSYEEKMPQTCPECQSDTIRYFGTGTQKVEEALTRLIPEARVIRMDVDTTRKKGAHEKLLDEFAAGHADILLGTQMIAKGLDFANVTLVGVLAADSLLHLPDFRAAEKTFQLLTQVSGRAGRHQLPGEVVIQTYTPDHYSVLLASEYNFPDFYQKEMEVRRSFHYPPYFYLSLITVSHPNQMKVMTATKKIVSLLAKTVNEQTSILGPTPSPLTRIKDRYRYQCMIKYKNEPELRKNIQKVLMVFEDEMKQDDLIISVDLQPYQLM